MYTVVYFVPDTVYIHQMNRVNSRNDDSSINIVMSIIIIL